jgi:hypothetical protein
MRLIYSTRCSNIQGSATKQQMAGQDEGRVGHEDP